MGVFAPKGKIGVPIMQDQDFEYFIQNMGSFYEQYGHKFLAIKNKNILGAYDSFNIALDETLKNNDVGTFIIQECFKNREESVNHFQGNVIFIPA
jgi:fibrillarin-like rRNA methylase